MKQTARSSTLSIRKVLPYRPNTLKQKLELDTLAWLRDFWTRTIVTWFALAISILALVLSYCSFEASKENREQLRTQPYQDLLREHLKRQ
jgi:predicted negative regulator of RcsB-dependent stress response